MKKIFLILAIISGLSTSCSKEGADLLDPATSGLTEADVFSSPQYSERFLMDIYRQIRPVLAHTDFAGPRWRNLAHLDLATDNGSNILAPNTNVNDFNHGAWTPSSTGMFWYHDWRDGAG